MGTSLELGQVASFLRTTPSVLRVFAGGLPEQATAWHPGAGKWCMREVIGHLTEENGRRLHTVAPILSPTLEF